MQADNNDAVNNNDGVAGAGNNVNDNQFDPGVVSGPNMNSMFWETCRVGKKFFVSLYRKGVKFVRHYMDIETLNDNFNRPVNPAMRQVWVNILNEIAGHARRQMDFSLKRASELQVVSVVAKAKADELNRDTEGNRRFIDAMQFPILRRGGRATSGGSIASAFIPWEPKYYWRGLSVGSINTVERGLDRLRIMEARRIKALGLQNTLEWRPTVIDAASDAALMSNRDTVWADHPLPDQPLATAADYTVPGNVNPHALNLVNQLNVIAAGGDGDLGALIQGARDAMGI